MGALTDAHGLVRDADRRAVGAFVRRLDGRYEIVRVLVYGSRARGDAGCDSDLDLAVNLDGATGDRWTVARKMARIAFDVLMETDVLVDPLPIWRSELDRSNDFRNPALMQAILRDGISA